MKGNKKIIDTLNSLLSDELTAIKSGAPHLGLDSETVLALLGETTFDIYLNDRICWKNVPSSVWEFRIGGYQVIKKWLSYRDKKVLGRSLNLDEVRQVTNMTRRLAAIILLQSQLNDNYLQVKRSPFNW